MGAPGHMRHIAAGVSDIGRVRKNNEDALSVNCFTASGRYVSSAIVCDGMGGLAKGEIASAITIKCMNEGVRDNLRMALRSDMTFDKAVVYSKIKQQAYDAHEELARYSRNVVTSEYTEEEAEYLRENRPSELNMGSTLSYLLVSEVHFITATVGDSRIYLVRDGIVHRLTKDQTDAQRLYERGEITRDELEISPLRSTLISSISSYRDLPEVFFSSGAACVGDTYIVCSDGFYHRVTPDELVSLSGVRTREETEYLLKEIIEKLKDRGESDNISAAVIHLIETEG